MRTLKGWCTSLLRVYFLFVGMISPADDDDDDDDDDGDDVNDGGDVDDVNDGVMMMMV